MKSKSYLVTGGTGFLGSSLVRRLVTAGARVRVLDNNLRGRAERLAGLDHDFEYIEGDVRNPAIVERACQGIDTVCHLAFVNGTQFFYSHPELVLEVGVKGMMNVLDGCIAHGVQELLLVSSSEVYQLAPRIPTDEQVPLMIPDVLNPRYSYAGGKIISEVLALNYGRKKIGRVVVVRPHNVYGPDMGWEHVIPQFVLRMKELAAESRDLVRFPIQGDGSETRAFVYIDDFTDGLVIAMERGEHMGIYHVGTTEEIAIADVARAVGQYFGRDVQIVPGPLLQGGTARRCPDISKVAALGYRPKYAFAAGLPLAARWYADNAHRAPSSERSLV
jgi:nucleoside-diphosphate-sugar epimerase